MRESSARIVPLSRRTLGTSVLRDVLPENLSKFGLVVCALWPVKPALNLAQRAGCTERHANLIIAGKRKPNARAALAVYAEIID
jgi:hypothetical protein